MTESHQLTDLFSAEDGLNFQIGRPSPKKHMCQFFLQANYCVLPSFSEIREWEEKYKNWEQKGDNLDFRPNVHHEIFDSQAVILFQDGKWRKTTVSGEGFEDAFDAGMDFPVAYIESTGNLGLGKWVKRKGYTLDWSAWLGEEESYMDWQDILLAASKEFSEDLSQEQFLSSLLELEWSPSVDWETGIDEGNFEIKREIFSID